MKIEITAHLTTDNGLEFTVGPFETPVGFGTGGPSSEEVTDVDNWFIEHLQVEESLSWKFESGVFTAGSESLSAVDIDDAEYEIFEIEEEES